MTPMYLIKNKYCTKNNIALIRIFYYQFDQIEEIIADAIYTRELMLIVW